MVEDRFSAAYISRADVLAVIRELDGDARFFRVVGRMRRRFGRSDIDERVIDRALQRERRAGVIESVARRWRRVEGRSDG